MTVRFGDTDPRGRLRLDALARFLQDLGNDDFADAGLDPLSPWVARRSVVVSSRWPRLGERAPSATWCGGLGGRWAERRSTVGGVDIATLWIHVDRDGRPTRVPRWFLDVYGEAAGDRTVSSKLSLPAPPASAPRRPWTVRAADLDVLGHVNNTVTWALAEEVCAADGVEPGVAILEYVRPIAAGQQVDLVLQPGAAWLVSGDDVCAAASVEPLRPD